MFYRSAPGSGHLITIAQFIFIAIHGVVFTAKFGTVQRKIPMQNYIVLVTFFFITSVFNNWAFSFNIPVPLHMIFRAVRNVIVIVYKNVMHLVLQGSLIANMIMGIIIMKKMYTSSKFLAVAMITLGIILCTYISSIKVIAMYFLSDDMYFIISAFTAMFKL